MGHYTDVVQAFCVSKHRQSHCLFNSRSVYANVGLLTRCEGNRWVESPNKRPVMRNVFPCHVVFVFHQIGSYLYVDFYPRPVLAFGYCHRPCLCICQCVCMCVCINHLLVRTITHQPFKLKSPNLKHRCKTPWLRCLLFWGVIDLELQGQIERESRILPHFELVRTITCHPFKLESPNLDKKCILVQLRCLLV